MKRILSSLLMLTMLLSALSLNFAVQADTQTTTPEILYYNDFNVENDLGDFTMYGAPEGYSPEISDGALYFPGGVGDVSMRYTTAEPLIDFSKETTKPELVLEMRVKTHFGQTGYFSTYANNISRINTMQINNKGELYTYRTSGTKLADTIKGEWNTITIVYGNDSKNPTRYIYLNGTKVGECTGTNSANVSENVYATTGKLTLALLPYLPLKGTYIYIDYIKISEKPTSITARTLNVDNDNVVVSFTSTPTSISENNFSLASGAEINGIDKINETTYRLWTSSDLSVTDTLTVSGITDTIGNQITSQTIELNASEASDITEEIVYHDFQFDEATTKLPTGLTGQLTVKDGYATLSNTTSVVARAQLAEVTNEQAALPELVLEFRSKMNLGSDKGDYMNYDNSSNYGDGKVFFYSSLSYLKDINAWGWKQDTTVNGYIDDVTKYHTYAIKYSNTDNTRSLYIDGVYAGTSPNTEGENGWIDGTIKICFKLYSANKDSSSDFDYIKLYAPGSSFVGEVNDAQQTELNKITLDFNSATWNISTANVRVNGKAPASVTCIDEKTYKYEVTLTELLKPETEYKVSLNGVSNAIGQETYDVLSFTTRALEAGEAYYTIGKGGVVTANGEEIADGTFAEAAGTIVVKANKGYKAVVKVNGSEIAENNKYGEYTIDTTNGAEIEVTFEEAVTPSFSTPVSFVDESAPDTSYTFVRLNMATDSFGVIVSKDSNKLNAEDADGVTTFILPATNGSNAFGEYGISIKDRAEGNVLGNKYYVRPYAKLGDTYYYQNPVTVNVTTVQ